jgi:hypothetical protein
MNPPTPKKYKSYTSPKSPKSKRPRDAAQKIQRTFRKRILDEDERPPTTRPSVQQMINNILSMKDLNDLRLKQARRATGPRNSSRAQFDLGATGSW